MLKNMEKLKPNLQELCQIFVKQDVGYFLQFWHSRHCIHFYSYLDDGPACYLGAGTFLENNDVVAQHQVLARRL